MAKLMNLFNVLSGYGRITVVVIFLVIEYNFADLNV